MRNVPLVYLAAPLFNARERRFNEELARALEPYVDLFLPQRDGELLTELVASGMKERLAESRVFQADSRAMQSSHLLVAVLDAAHIDEGVAFEVGFMNGRGVPCIGLQSDVRRALPSGNNPMIAQGLSQIFQNVEEVVDWVADWSAHWREHIRIVA
jgi:nucleoside 2-deoxyribosyltransferase